jgi:hypothetical protein
LNDKKVIPTDIFVKFYERLAVWKRGHCGFAKWDFYEICDPLGKVTVRISGEDL